VIYEPDKTNNHFMLKVGIHSRWEIILITLQAVTVFIDDDVDAFMEYVRKLYLCLPILQS
jgi:hypothetical protein